MQQDMTQYRPAKIWWLWVPLVFLAVQLVIERVFDQPTLVIMHTEGGPHESLQFFLLVAALIVAVRTLIGFPVRARPWLAGWVALAAVCCLYVAGEEVSWGQHIIGWTTPEFWAAVNDQNETNFHNTSSWLDQKPRLLLEIGVLVGGILIPLARRFRPGLLPARFAVIYPPDWLWVTASCAVLCKLIDGVAEAFGGNVFERVSEVIELYLYWFVFLYLLYIRARLRAL